MSIREISLTNLVNIAIETELQTANEQYGNYFNTHHEAYGVLLEEFEELEHEIVQAKHCLSNLWEKVKSDTDPDSALFRFENVAKMLIREALQVAAMIEKYKQTNDLFNGTGHE
jgi:hypothetical protein